MPKKRKFTTLLTVIILLSLGAMVYLVRPMLRQDNHPRALRIDTLSARPSRDGRSQTLHIEGDGFNRRTEVALAQDLGNHRAVAATFNTLGPINDMAFSGDTAYLANRDKGIQIVDFSNPLKPVLQLSSHRTLSPLKLALGEQKLWAAMGRDGILVVPNGFFDLSSTSNSPATITKPIRFTPSGHPIDLILFDDDTACLALAGDGIGFVTLGAGDGKKVLSTLALPGHASKVARSGRTIYVANFQEGLQIVDAADLSKPRLLKTLNEFEKIGDIKISGNLAYIVSKGQFAILDISTPESPVTLSTIDFIDTAFVSNINLADGRAYLLNKSGILIIDIEKPSSPFISNWVDIRSPHRVVVRGNYLVVAQGENGLRIIDRTKLNHSPPNLYASRTRAKDFLIHEDLAYLASGNRGLEIVDTASVPTKSLAVIALPGFSNSIARHEKTLYVASFDPGVQMVDIRNPVSPKQVGTIPGSEGATRVVVSEQRAFMLLSAKRPPSAPGARSKTVSILQVYDLSTAHSPELLGQKEFQHQVANMAVNGDLIYLACNQRGLVIMDVSDPQSPREVATAALPWPQQNFAHSRDVAVKEGFVFVANGGEGVQVFDMKNPKKPTLVASVKTPGFVNTAALSGNTLYVSDHKKTLLTLDVTEPTKARITGILDLALVPRRIALTEESLYLVSNLVPLMKVPLPATPRKVKISGDSELSATFACSDIPQNAIVQLINGPHIVSYPAELECPAETQP